MNRFLTHALLAACCVGPAAAGPVVRPGPAGSPEAVAPAVVEAGPELAAALRGERAAVRAAVTLAGREETLELERFEVLAPGAELVVVDGRGERPALWDASRVVLLRGKLAGREGSSVFLASSPGLGVVGQVSGPAGRLVVSTPAEMGVDRLVLQAGGGAGSRPAGLPMCGTDTSGWAGPRRGAELGASSSLLPGAQPGARYVVELAVDTDLEFFELFEDEQVAMDYLVALYGQVSSVFTRDVGVRLQLVFARLWTVEDPFDAPGNPLDQFRSYWRQNMRHVHRDVAQLCSGRRDLNAGGVAYLSAVCQLSSGYSWAGYIAGDLARLGVGTHLNGDMVVVAHELGHNHGAPHTHDQGLDECDDAWAAPRRGSIMSYCGQSYSGGDANHDTEFHSESIASMLAYLATADCLFADCNGNGIDDSDDIAAGRSEDANGNGVPDECEDCNRNGVLDPEDIASGASADVNGNGIPDECEPDCDGNRIPDDWDIATGTHEDHNGDGVPDLCEIDCDGNGVADSLDINLDMSLDVDRDGRLDACQDCNGDGTNDIDALQQARNVLVLSLDDLRLREFFGETGVLVGESGPLDASPQDVVITPDRRVLVSAGDTIHEFDAHMNYMGPLARGLTTPAGMLLTHAGTLLVAERAAWRIAEVDLSTGESRRFAEAGGSPFALAYGPEGGLFVTSGTFDEVHEHDPQTGELLRAYVPFSNNGGLDDPRGLAFTRNGTLLVASRGSGEILAFAPRTAEPLGRWNRNGYREILALDQPWDIVIGPDDDVYVTDNHIHRRTPPPGDPAALHLTQARVFQFDWRNGNYRRALVQGNDTGLFRPSGFAFMPDMGLDCNMNFVPDDCDIASGYSRDRNANGVPDECEACPADLTGSADPADPSWGIPDGVIDVDDFFYFLDRFAAGDPAADLTGSADPTSPRYGRPDGAVDIDDFFYFLDRFAEGCPG